MRELDLGFTGSSNGLTDVQTHVLRANISATLKDYEVRARHGMCQGGDERFHYICRDLGISPIIGHPGHDRKGNSPKHVEVDVDVREDPMFYLDRDVVIARRCHQLFACPAGPETPRGGTWYTIRRAMNFDRPILIIYPDGSVDARNGMIERGTADLNDA